MHAAETVGATRILGEGLWRVETVARCLTAPSLIWRTTHWRCESGAAFNVIVTVETPGSAREAKIRRYRRGYAPVDARSSRCPLPGRKPA